MSESAHQGRQWLGLLLGGFALVALATFFIAEHGWLRAILLGFPSMLVLWKAVQDDGQVNWLETSTMIAIFLLVIYLLVAHG